MGGHLAGMVWLQRPDQAVEEPAAARQPFLKQAIHLRREPDGGGPGADFRLIAGRRAVQPEHAPFDGPFWGGTRPDIRLPQDCHEPSRDSPAAGTFPARQIGVPDTTKTAARNQEGNRLQQVGLATAIRAEQDADSRGRAPCQRGVIAEIGQDQTLEAKHGGKMAAGRITGKPGMGAGSQRLGDPAT